MIVAVSATVMAVLKKVLAFLLGDKKERKFLGYTIGIVLFIALLPVIAIYGLFGWMSGNDAAGIIGYDAVYEKLPTEIREQISSAVHRIQITADMIEIVFRENGLTDEDITKAKLIYLSSLTEKHDEENFYERLAECFLKVSEESDLLTNISSAFGVDFTEADRQQFNNYFGGG